MYWFLPVALSIAAAFLVGGWAFLDAVERQARRDALDRYRMRRRRVRMARHVRERKGQCSCRLDRD